MSTPSGQVVGSVSGGEDGGVQADRVPSPDQCVEQERAEDSAFEEPAGTGGHGVVNQFHPAQATCEAAEVGVFENIEVGKSTDSAERSAANEDSLVAVEPPAHSVAHSLSASGTNSE